MHPDSAQLETAISSLVQARLQLPVNTAQKLILRAFTGIRYWHATCSFIPCILCVYHTEQ